MNTLTFAQERTQVYFNHTGIFYTETKTIWGAYAPQDYGCSRPTNYPVWLETNNYIHFDYGGDGGTPEVALFALDYLLYTNDTTKFLRYLPLVISTADFFRQHYANRSTNGDLMIDISYPNIRNVLVYMGYDDQRSDQLLRKRSTDRRWFTYFSRKNVSVTFGYSNPATDHGN